MELKLILSLMFTLALQKANCLTFCQEKKKWLNTGEVQ